MPWGTTSPFLYSQTESNFFSELKAFYLSQCIARSHRDISMSLEGNETKKSIDIKMDRYVKKKEIKKINSSVIFCNQKRFPFYKLLSIKVPNEIKILYD